MTWKCSTLRTDLILVQFLNHRTYNQTSTKEDSSYVYHPEEGEW